MPTAGTIKKEDDKEYITSFKDKGTRSYFPAPAPRRLKRSRRPETSSLASMEGQVESTIGGAGNDMATDFTGFEDHDSEGPVFETKLMTHTKQADLSVFITEAT
ncbi:MAG: hypothetical protein VXV91_04435, partial [Verrucomicrobiota bacterium]|nr:hypothetical protein [Verrucomicrobiota bacterium]